MLSSPWRLEKSNPATYARPLGLTEEIFYWDASFEGTADSVVAAEVEILEGIDPTSLLSPSNVEKAWTSLKCQYPLLGSRIVKRENQKKPLWFIVEETRIRSCGPDDIQFFDVASSQEAKSVLTKIPHSPRILSEDLLACLLIIRRTDNSRRFHVLIPAAHSITDGNANATILRSLLDKLSRPASIIETWPIQERLALSSASEDLLPTLGLSIARRRWRRAIGAVISASRMAKLHGGHTLPTKVTKTTMYQPAGSGDIRTIFTKEETQAILQGCRQLGITFGVAYPVIGQIALTRILCSKYIQGSITQEEWEFRQREPMITGGPINLRPFLDTKWFEKGGKTNVSLSVAFFYYGLPFMTLGTARNFIKPGSSIPSYSDLMTKNRFLYRCGIIKKQADRVIRHPLHYEIGSARFPDRILYGKTVANNWKRKVLLQTPDDSRMLSVQEIAAAGIVFGHGGSSFGNTDGMYPEFYPLERDKTRTLQLIEAGISLHCRPRELYLGASSGKGQLRLNVFYDTNCYEEQVVQEWLAEVKNAVLHYLIPQRLTSSHL